MKPESLIDLYAEQIPATLAKGKFKGRRVIMAVPSTQTFIQHMQLANVHGASRDELVKGQLQMQMGCDPSGIVVRTVDVGAVHRDGKQKAEVICYAMARGNVMRFMNLLNKLKLNVVGVHTETVALTRSFDHLTRRAGDNEVATMYVDLGWGGTNVAITHGRQTVFSRAIQLGGRHFDQCIADALHCDLPTARGHRLAMQGPSAPTTRSSLMGGKRNAAIMNVATAAQASTPDGASSQDAEGATAVEEERRSSDAALAFGATVHAKSEASLEVSGVDLRETVDMIADELCMCIRYHQGVFRGRHIDRVILLGGEARQLWFCQHLVKQLRLPAQLGDPLARFSREGTPKILNVDLEKAQPGWAVPCGLCLAPTDL